MQSTCTECCTIDETRRTRTSKSNSITYVNRRHAVAIEPQSQTPVHGPTTAGRNLEQVMPFPASLRALFRFPPASTGCSEDLSLPGYIYYQNPSKLRPSLSSSTNFSHSVRPLFSNMSRHHPDLVMCRKQPGISIGRLCDKCDGKCPVCDSYVRPTTLVRICDECSFGNYQNKCIVCGGEGISDAFYCFECTRLEKDRDGCPKIINLGSSRTDLFYQKKSFRNH